MDVDINNGYVPLRQYVARYVARHAIKRTEDNTRKRLRRLLALHR